MAPVIRSIAWASASATLSRAFASASAARIFACFLPSAWLISDCRMPSAWRMRDCFSASAVRIAARRSRSARICFSMASRMSRGGLMSLSSTRLTFAPHLCVASSRISRSLALMVSRDESTWCQSIARGLSMSGMIKLTPEDRVRWYLPSRSMIIVWACWTMRIPLATIEIASSAIAAGTMSEPMLSISGLLVHVQRRAFDPYHHHARAWLEHRVHERRAAPVLPLHHDPAPAGGGVDPLGDDAHPPHQGVHVGLDLVRGGGDVPEQEGTDADQREQRPGCEAQDRPQAPRHHERDDARQHTPHRHAQQPEPRRQHLGDRSEERRVGKECRSRWSPYH